MASRLSSNMSLGDIISAKIFYHLLYTNSIHKDIQKGCASSSAHRSDLGVLADGFASANTPYACLMKALAQPGCPHY
jgi:hypothetical protein